MKTNQLLPDGPHLVSYRGFAEQVNRTFPNRAQAEQWARQAGVFERALIERIERAKIKDTYHRRSYRGKVGTVFHNVQFNKAYFRTDEPMALVLIDRDYLEVLP